MRVDAVLAVRVKDVVAELADYQVVGVQTVGVRAHDDRVDDVQWLTVARRPAHGTPALVCETCEYLAGPADLDVLQSARPVVSEAQAVPETAHLQFALEDDRLRFRSDGVQAAGIVDVQDCVTTEAQYCAGFDLNGRSDAVADAGVLCAGEVVVALLGPVHESAGNSDVRRNRHAALVARRWWVT